MSQTYPKIIPSLGSVLISGTRSVIGQPQIAKLLRRLERTKIPSIPSNNSFRFVDISVHSLGIIELELETPENTRRIPALKDIAPLDVPALLDFDVLDGDGLYAHNVINRLVHRQVISRPGELPDYQDSWNVPPVRHDNHFYAKLRFTRSTFYTTAQLQKMHRQFAHPSAGNLYSLLKQA